jgi:hypothetical protein
VISQAADQGTIPVQELDYLGSVICELGSREWRAEEEDAFNEALSVLEEYFLILLLGSIPAVVGMKGVDKSLGGSAS